MKAIVAGGGIGGLSVAICLRLRGWDVEVLERSDDIREIGAGLQVAANGYRVLEAMGVTPYLEETEFRPEAIEMRLARTGRRLFRIPIKDISEERWNGPYVNIHRHDLITALHKRVLAVGGIKVRTKARVTGYNETDKNVAVQFQGGRVYGDILIGAEGIRSATRTQLVGAQEPRFTGNRAWRTVVPVDQLRGPVPPPTACIWAGSGRHVVTTRVRKGNMVNFVGIVEQSEWKEEGWHHRGDPEEALRDFDGWHPMVRGVLRSAPKLHKWALFDHAPLPVWSKGRVCLLGDSCHAMLPSMAQAAVQAIEDAWVLAGCLDDYDADRAFQAYFNLRQPRTTEIQATSAKNLTIFHKKSVLEKLAGYGPIWVAGKIMPDIFHRRQDWVYGHDVLSEVSPLPWDSS